MKTVTHRDGITQPVKDVIAQVASASPARPSSSPMPGKYRDDLIEIPQ